MQSPPLDSYGYCNCSITPFLPSQAGRLWLLVHNLAFSARRFLTLCSRDRWAIRRVSIINESTCRVVLMHGQTWRGMSTEQRRVTRRPPEPNKPTPTSEWSDGTQTGVGSKYTALYEDCGRLSWGHERSSRWTRLSRSVPSYSPALFSHL